MHYNNSILKPSTGNGSIAFTNDATYANLLGQKRNLHRKRVQIPKRWLGPLTWSKGLGVGTFPLSALFYNYSVWGRVNLVPRTHRITVTWKVYPTIISYPGISKYFMAEQFSCTVESGYEIEIRIIFGLWRLKIILSREHLLNIRMNGIIVYLARAAFCSTAVFKFCTKKSAR